MSMNIFEFKNRKETGMDSAREERWVRCLRVSVWQTPLQISLYTLLWMQRTWIFLMSLMRSFLRCRLLLTRLRVTYPVMVTWRAMWSRSLRPPLHSFGLFPATWNIFKGYVLIDMVQNRQNAWRVPAVGAFRICPGPCMDLALKFLRVKKAQKRFLWKMILPVFESGVLNPVMDLMRPYDILWMKMIWLLTLSLGLHVFSENACIWFYLHRWSHLAGRRDLLEVRNNRHVSK